MDSFFDVIIIFVIIFSIINAIFGKKKAQQKKQENDEPSARDKKRNSVDILEQIFGVPPQQKEPEFNTNMTDEYSTWNPEAEFSKDSTAKNSTVTKSNEIKFDTRRKERADVDYDKLKSLENLSLHKQKLTLLTNDLDNEIRYNKKQMELIKNLRDPKTLRDYVFVSEILGKPKAFSDY